MLTETKLRSLKPRERLYKVTDRDGMYVAVLPSGALSFRYNYTHQGKQKTLTIGRHGKITLAEARERLIAAKKTLDAGVSPSQQKRQAKAVISVVSVGTLHDWFLKWMDKDGLAENSKRSARMVLKSIGDLSKKQINTITTKEIKLIINNKTPALALQIIRIISAVTNIAIHNGVEMINPVSSIKKNLIATTKYRERVLSKTEITKVFCAINMIEDYQLHKIAFKLLLLTMVRKMELLDAKWTEFDFDNKTWTIPAERMKAGRAHTVYLSSQAITLFNDLRCVSFNTEFVFDLHGKNKPASKNFLNRFCDLLIKTSKLDKFSPHDLRRTASTHLNNEGYNSDWIEASLAHTKHGVRGVYNKAEYAEQRRSMLQDWADMIDRLSIKIP